MEKEFEYKEEYAWLTNICLNVTDACNLACRYCFVEQHPHYMTLDVAKQAVHFILDNLEKKNKKFNKNDRASITYFGGEPTLMWDEIIVPLTNYIKENKFPINLGMTTNGTLLNKEKISFLKEHNFSILLSADGNEYTQNFNRPCQNKDINSFDLLKNNIPLILEAFPNVTMRATVYAPTANTIFNTYMFAVEQGFKNIFIMPDIRHPWNEEQIEIMMQELDKIYMFMSYCYKNNIMPLGFSTIDRMFKTLYLYALGPAETNISRTPNRCGLGTTSGSVGYDGSIYGCQEQVSKDIADIFYIGNLKTGIDKNLHINLLQKYTYKQKAYCKDKEYCNTCLLKENCTGWTCPSTSWDLYKDFHADSVVACRWREKIFANNFILYSQFKNNDIFNKYLEGVNKYEL